LLISIRDDVLAEELHGIIEEDDDEDFDDDAELLDLAEDAEDDCKPLIESTDENQGIRYIHLVRVCLFLCGMGVFARCEGFLLQTQVRCFCMHVCGAHSTQLFGQCLGYGLGYYAQANAVLFLPGVVVLIFQSKFDPILDSKFGTLRCNFYRLLITTICTSSVVIVSCPVCV
jgi:hypothetical protein